MDGTGFRKVTDVVQTASAVWQLIGPVWSPVPFDGINYKIAYSDIGAGGYADIYVINLDGSDPVNLTNTPDLNERKPTWSPLATRLAAVVTDVNTSESDLIVYDLGLVGGVPTITGSTNVTAGGPLSNAPVQSPDWAKNEDKLAVHVSMPEGRQDIWVTDLLDPTNPVNLTCTTDQGEVFPTWSPDDTEIAFQTSGEIHKVNTTAGCSPSEKIAAPGESVFKFSGPDWRRSDP